MNKRSAVLIAAGLVLTLVVGGLAVSLGLTGPAPVNAAGPVRPERVVKVERRTVTIHQDAGPTSTEAVTLSAPAMDDDAEDGYDEDESEHESESHEDFDEEESEGSG